VKFGVELKIGHEVVADVAGVHFLDQAVQHLKIDV
jgi:hypothetical protein